MRPENSYHLLLTTTLADGEAVQGLQWHDVFDGAARMQDREPETSPLQRALLRVLQALPIEQHL
jgi:putative cardiolipin synthase